MIFRLSQRLSEKIKTGRLDRLPLDDNPLAERRARMRSGQIGGIGPGPALAKDWAGDFRQRVLEPDRRTFGRPLHRAGVVGIEIRRLGPRAGTSERFACVIKCMLISDRYAPN